MTDYRELTDSDWLGQWDLGNKEYVLVIASVERFVPLQKRKKKDPRTGKMREELNTRIDIGFKGAKKHWLAGKASQEIISALYGREIENWIGKSLTLYVDPTVTMKGVQVGGIRPKAVAPRKPPSTEMPDGALDAAKREQIDRARDQADDEQPAAPMREPGEEG